MEISDLISLNKNIYYSCQNKQNFEFYSFYNEANKKNFNKKFLLNEIH